MQQHKYKVDSTSMSSETTQLIKTKVSRMPTVFFSDFAWAQLWTIIEYCKDEVGWYGLVDETTEGDYVISEIFVPEQEVSSATTDIEPEAMGKLAAQLEAAGKDSSKLRYWGHSHVHMAVRPSVTDEEQIQEYLDHVDWFIRGIHNKKMESKLDVYDVTNNIIHQCCKGQRVPAALSHDDKVGLIKEIDANVTKKWQNYGGYRGPQNPRTNVNGTVQSVNGNVKNQKPQSQGGAMTPSQHNQQQLNDQWEGFEDDDVRFAGYGYGGNGRGNFQRGGQGTNDPATPKK